MFGKRNAVYFLQKIIYSSDENAATFSSTTLRQIKRLF